MSKLANTSLPQSLAYALKGVKHIFKNERNFRLHIFSTVVVLFLAFYFKCDLLEIALLVIVISIVLVSEMINSAIEHTWDKLEPNHHPVVGMIKDMMAGAVMVAATSAFVVGLIIIIRHII